VSEALSEKWPSVELKAVRERVVLALAPTAQELPAAPAAAGGADRRRSLVPEKSTQGIRVLGAGLAVEAAEEAYGSHTRILRERHQFHLTRS
jgi:hypothetical protein